MAFPLRAWAAAGPYPGSVLSPRTEKVAVTTDRFGDRVETRDVDDAFRGVASQRTISNRFGDTVFETDVADRFSGRVHSSRVRSESPVGRNRGFGDRGYLIDDPLHRRGFPVDPLYASDRLRRDMVLDDAALYRRAHYGDAFYGRGDAFYGRGDAFYGRGDAFYGRGDAFYGRGDAFYGRGEAFYGRGFHGHGFYDGNIRRSALLDDAFTRRAAKYDLDDITWSRAAYRNPLTGTLI